MVLHGALAGLVVFWALINGLFHHNTWGGTPGGGAVEVNLTSTIPLPAQKINQNVLTTETPSEAPAPPAPKEQHQVDTTAIPLAGKPAKPTVKETPKTQPHQAQPLRDNRATYGEQSGSVMPRATAPSATNGPISVADSDFGSRFPWYVDGIKRKLQQNQNMQEVDPRTPKGSQALLVFTIHRDGSQSEVQLTQSSGSATLDRACMRAVQRVDTFGQLPGGYNQSTLKASYDCEF